MTTNSFIFYWQSNRAWWKYNENKTPVLLPSAPQKAKSSYEEYMKRKERLKRISNEPIILDE